MTHLTLVTHQPHLTTHRAKHLSQQLGHFALLEGQVSLAVEDTEDDIAEASDGDGAPDGLGPLATSKVNQMEPRPSAQEDRAGVRLGLASD